MIEKRNNGKKKEKEMKNNFILSILIIPLLFLGCVTNDKKFDVKVLEPIQIDRTEVYKLDTSNIDNLFINTLEQINNDIIITTNENDETVIIMDEETFAKIADISEIAEAYQNTIDQQTDLVNVYVDEINALKELVKLERERAIIYKDLWITSNELYLQEAKLRKRDNLMNNIKFYGSNAIWLLVVATM